MNTNTNDATTTWPDLGIALYDRLTGRNAEITYDFDELRVNVPSSTGESSPAAQWTLSGAVRIRTREVASGNA